MRVHQSARSFSGTHTRQTDEAERKKSIGKSIQVWARKYQAIAEDGVLESSCMLYSSSTDDSIIVAALSTPGRRVSPPGGWILPSGI